MLPAGSLFDPPVISLDIPVTAAAVAGTAFPESSRIEGVNLLPHFLGQTRRPPHEALYWRTSGGTAWAVRQGHWKLLKRGKNPEELYNLQTDIGETKNLAADNPDKVVQLKRLYDEWNRHNIRPVFESPRAAKPAPKKPESRKPSP